ncbi:MAG: hypothetical protein KDJ28_07160 [Candidatus Competibacteraceae bacterium]|nr:hypothetical protein [Candidatus Competibacteraceae bacterium]
MKKSKLCKAIAMATALGGLGVGAYLPTASAVNLPANSLGDVLIFPYYTTRDGYQTTLSFLNTDESNLIAVKFRFYEGYNSRDALDFNVLLSPGDVFAAVVEEGASGPVVRRAANDTTCTVPHIPFGNTTANPPVPSGSLPISTAAFSGNSLVFDAARANTDGGPADVDRLREGYVVAIVMGHYPVPGPSAILNGAVHDSSGVNTEAECIAAANLFTQTAVKGGTAALFGEPINSLRGDYTLLNVARGTSVGGNAVALANFFTVTPLPTDTVSTVGVGPRPNCTVVFTDKFGYAGTPVAWDPNTSAASCPNLITAQQPFFFLEPTLNDAYPPEAVVFVNGVPGGTGSLGQNLGVTPLTWAPSTSTVGSTDVDYGFLAVSEVLRARTIVNEWSVNPNLGVESAWVITHPTKAFFVDRDGFDSPQASVNTLRFPGTLGAASVPPIAVDGFLAPFARTFNGTSCNQVGFRLYNRDEVGNSPSAGGVVPSPAQPLANLSLCYETNVIPFTSDNFVFNSVLLPSLVDQLYESVDKVAGADPSMLKPFGWMRLDLDTDPQAKNGTTTLAGPGLPAVGFMLRQRVIPGTADTYSDISDHSVKR